MYQNTHSTAFFKECYHDSSLYIINVGSLIHAFPKGKLSQTFSSMFKINVNINVHSYGARQAALFHTPVGRTAKEYQFTTIYLPR